MSVKDTIKKGYDCFNKGDMETFFNEVVHDDCVWTFPGEPGKHPLSGIHKGKQAMMEGFSKIPTHWENFQVIPGEMISEDNKVFVKVNGKASGMDTIFGHYFEVTDGKITTMITYDDTLSAFNSMK
jgi:ketosteroid isomerase-like protein